MPATGKEAVSLKQARTMFRRIMGDLTNQMNREIHSAVVDKLEATDLIAGANVTIIPDPETSHVTIAANFPEIPEINLATDAEAKGFLGY